MTISEFASLVDASIDTYYEKIGLINPSREKYQRDYPNKDVEVFLAIKKLFMVGIKLHDIKVLLNMEEKRTIT